MAIINLEGAKKSRKLFKCNNCGEIFQPPSRYFLIRIKGKLVKICLICERYG